MHGNIKHALSDHWSCGNKDNNFYNGGGGGGGSNPL